MTATTSADFAPPQSRVYDLRSADAQRQARYHRDCWGRLYTDIHILDSHHVALVFRLAPDERWRDWERVRLEWLLSEQAA